MSTAQKKIQVTPKQEGKSPASKDVHGVHHPLLGLRQEVDNLFDNFFSSFSLGPFGRSHLEFNPFRRVGRQFGLIDELMPDMDVRQTEKDFRVSIELPGMSSEDFDITIENGSLIIKGEKEERHDEENENRHISERCYGSIYRSVPLPRNIDEDKIDATFEKGVLDLRLPITVEPKTTSKKIEVESR